MENKLEILYQCSNAYAFMAGVSIYSLLSNANEKIKYDIYVLTKDMSIENRKNIEGLPENFKNIESKIEIIDATECDAFFEKCGVMIGEGSYATYYKLMIDSLFKDSSVERLFYIDADTLVLGDLSELLSFDFDGKPLALSHWEEVGKRFLSKAGIPKGQKAYAAGMIYFNLPEWRKRNCEQRIIDHLTNKQAFFSDADQGIINSEFQDEIALLPVAYNVYSLAYPFGKITQRGVLNSKLATDKQMRQAYENPQIVHFCGSFLGRPWEENNADSLKDMWWGYCSKTPWRNMKPLPEHIQKSRFLDFFRPFYLKAPKFLAESIYVILRRFMFR